MTVLQAKAAAMKAKNDKQEQMRHGLEVAEQMLGKKAVEVVAYS